MHLHANELNTIRGNLRDFVVRNKITFILPKATPLPEGETNSAKIRVIDYISLLDKR
ncbi:hypothetical protein ST201phi2-1p092 [Pseudomonas phage 201phi2-1]|uniref:Uncharacterized protein n=1 Tax=Pseudomonas phage 201phi2-1 TaxID=198110 RepID=B3FIV6_BP201|nr:hypothetical protein ST201phi2-1p092 [Pseudomonas phage 201phi2-1]ABY62925.1 hypothetical protein 201phi2-1p092 [Pseudomonas phage 201phi2-1]